jgi:hypothetical protein
MAAPMMAIMVPAVNFSSDMVFPSHAKSDILSINKHYWLPEEHTNTTQKTTETNTKPEQTQKPKHQNQSYHPKIPSTLHTRKPSKRRTSQITKKELENEGSKTET